MICYQCQERAKEMKVYRGLQRCDTIDCKNMVNIGYRACKDCSIRFGECEVCRGNLKAIESKRRK